MNESVIARLDNVSKIYEQGDRHTNALVAVTCSVRQGDRVAVVGPSGSGKSTLLHILGGVDRPTVGSVNWPAFDGNKDLRPSLVSYVFQTRSLLDSLDVLENVQLPLILTGVDREEAVERARTVLEKLGLGDLLTKLPEELSGGQAQRVALARALVTEPALLLADEPTGQLDHPTAKKLFDALFEALEGSGTTLVVATHDAIIAERMDTRWSIRHGIVEAGQ